MSKDISNGNSDGKNKAIDPKSNPDPDSIVPQLSSSGITFNELQIASKVLNAIGLLHPKYDKNKDKGNGNGNGKDTDKDNESNDENSKDSSGSGSKSGLEMYRHSNFRPIRKSLHGVYEIHKLQLYTGKTEDNYYKNKIQERTLKRQKLADTMTQQKYIGNTLLRKGRIDKLNQLKLDCKDEEEKKLLALTNGSSSSSGSGTGNKFLLKDKADGDDNNDTGAVNSNSERIKQQSMMVPDGHVETQSTNGTNKNGTNANSNTNTSDQDANGETDEKLLPKLRSCYVCKIRYRQLHKFYDQLCPSCATLNYNKRHQTIDLTNKIAIITGCRIKIGYQTTLKLLRSNCITIATTRFPNIAIDNYRKEHDYNDWKHLLYVYALDLRDVIGIECFIAHIKDKISHNLGGGTSTGTPTRACNGVDILINNACQTVRRPTGYYKPLVEREQYLWENGDVEHKTRLSACLEYEKIRRDLFLDQKKDDGKEQQQLGIGNGSGQIQSLCNTKTSDDTEMKETVQPQSSINSKSHEASQMEMDTKMDISPQKSTTSLTTANEVTTTMTMTNTELSSTAEESLSTTKAKTIPSPFETTGISHSTAMSQMVILPDDVGLSSKILPPGLSDINGQQLDLRKTNSWLLKIDQVSTPEIIECMFINAIAPFVLNSRLQSLLKVIPNGSTDVNDRPDRYIINVSAMEGKFYRYKMPNHPHTNMAKASLNMMTRTSAEDLAKKHRIFMNSVDTGWINDENPLEKASKIAKTNHFQTPIDEIDAAARILDPIFVGVTMDQEREQEQKERDDGGSEDKGTSSSTSKANSKRKNNGKTKKKKKVKDYGKFFKDYKETEW